MSLSMPLRSMRQPLSSLQLCAGRRRVLAQGLSNSRFESNCPGSGSLALPRYFSTQPPRRSNDNTPPPSPKPSKLPTESTPSTISSPALDTTSPSTEANPPASTRPPPLNLPERKPDTSTIKHLYHTGRAFVTFYKTGLGQIYTNTQLVRALRAIDSSSSSSSTSASPSPSSSSDSPPPKIKPNTRAAHILTTRWQHDIRRVPLFALFLLVFGEFTPLVLIAFPTVVPYTCRIPAQVDKVLTKTEERRKLAFRELALERENAIIQEAERQLGHRGPGTGGMAASTDVEGTTTTSTTGEEQAKDSTALATRYIPRILSLTTSIWDKAGLTSPFARRQTQARLAWLATDDTLLAQAGGVEALEDAEVLSACVERGIDVLKKPGPELRQVLVRWVELSMDGGKDAAGSGSGSDGAPAALKEEDEKSISEAHLARVQRLLMWRPEKW